MLHTTQNKTKSPFALPASEVKEPFVAIMGIRNGYIQLATRQENENYEALPTALLEAAKAWAAILQSNGAPKVYWITLSEVVTYLHVHLYPRWPADPQKESLCLRSGKK